MAFVTNRKRVTGLGSARGGTHHFWSMTVTAVALLFLVPAFVFSFGPLLGEPHEQVIATLSRPFPAIVVALMLIVGFHHFRLQFFACMDYCTMILVSKKGTDLGERVVGEFAAQIHGDSSGNGDRPGPLGTENIAGFDTKVFGDVLLDLLDRNPARVLLNDVFEDFLGLVDVNG